MTEKQTVRKTRGARRLAVVLVVFGLVTFLGQVRLCRAENELDRAVTAAKRGDYATALKVFTPLAKRGIARAQYNLGVCYQGGYGVPRNYGQALKWYRLAANQGHARAQYNLGVMYQVGYGAPGSYSQAAEWYRKSAEQGFVRAQMKIGIMYFRGLGVPRNYILAHMWLSLAASRGDAHAGRLRDYLEEKMTPAQMADARKLAAEWKPKKSRRRSGSGNGRGHDRPTPPGRLSTTGGLGPPQSNRANEPQPIK